MKIALLVSGDLGFIVLKKIIPNYKVEFVMTDKNSKSIKKFCVKNKIPMYEGNPRKSSSSMFYKNFSVDLIFSINYLYLIDENLIKYPNKFSINIHGSLLPKYRGRTPHVWSIINGEKKTGITVHLIENECDAGDIIYQEELSIENEDTGAIILNKFKMRYPEIALEIIKNIDKDKIKRLKQDHKKATYYPKRSPIDGKINLSLNSKDICNWVRAQAYPYPGAFVFFEDYKVIFDKVIKTDLSFDKNLSNGTIINVNPLLFKVNDAILKVTKHRFDSGKIKKNKIFK